MFAACRQVGLFRVTLSKRERALGTILTELSEATTLSFDISDTSECDGVLQVTVYDTTTGIAMAER